MSRKATPAHWFVLAILVLSVGVRPAMAQTYLGRTEISLYGIGLKVEPATQTVPKGFATIVSTFLQGATQPAGLPPFAPDAEVRATLRGPSFPTPIELTAKPNSPFNIPVLTVAGRHSVDNIRLVSGNDVLLYGSPENVTIEVIEKLLVTTVTARPLTADEIREKGIVFDKSNFQAYNFTAAFAIDDGSKINVAFPVVLPTLVSPELRNTTVGLQSVDAPLLKSLQTIIPDTLQIQARIPNLSVIGFQLTLDEQAASQDFFVPPIPGVIVIPGDIGFLNQFFSVMLMVANVAPNGSGLVVSDLTASIVLPPGKDQVVGSDDDPLAMAKRADGEYPRVVPVTQPGPDGKLGTGDDITTLGPGETANAEYLVEGRREGTHVVEMELSGTLHGLPIGPVPVHGRAAGAVLVRNPKFTLTFTHPDVVNAGEPYALDVTVTNTSESPANFVSVNLFAGNISGARLDGEPTQSVDSIPAGDSATVTFNLTSFRTGTVTAATLDSDDNVAGRFVLKSAVGELGVPLSPDSLILPKEADGLPADLKSAALGLLGRAWAVATAPAAALPKDLTRFSKQLVLDRAVETAEAGFRISLGESVAQSATTLLMDFLGSEYTKLSQKVPQNDTTGLLALLQRDVQGFDLVRRRSVRGQVFADTVANHLGGPLANGAMTFHRTLAEQLVTRPGHLSILVSSPAGLPISTLLVSADGLHTGVGADGTTLKEIPYSESVAIRNAANQVTAQLIIVAVPQSPGYTVQLTANAAAPAGATYDVSVAYPGDGGGLRFASWSALGLSDVPILQQQPSETPQIVFTRVGTASPSGRSVSSSVVQDPPPTILGAFQIANADIAGCPADQRTYPVGRVVAVLFSEEVTRESVESRLSVANSSAFLADGNRVVGVALQPGGRIAYVALREPIGPFVPRTMTVEGVKDLAGHAMTSAQTVPINVTVGNDAGVVSGRVLNADGSVAAGVTVQLFYEFSCGDGVNLVGIAEEPAADDGTYQFDYVLNAPGMTIRMVALNEETGEQRTLRYRLARSGQRLNVDIVLVGRGVLQGRTLSESGQPLSGTALRITSLTDQTAYAATSAADGSYVASGIPVGNVLIEAVNVARPAQLFVAGRIPFAGATVDQDLTLLDVSTEVIVEKKGTLTGRVVQADGTTPVTDVPVVVYYGTRSQPNVACAPPPGSSGEPSECFVALARTDNAGLFHFDHVVAGALRINTFDQGNLLEGNVRLTLAENETRDVTVLIAGGFATVKGVVLDASHQPVPDAVVGGGYSLVNVNPDGTFTLTDVPVGRRRLVAASNALQATAETTVDLVQAGEVVNATIVMPPVGGVAGVVRGHDGAPQANIKVYVIQDCYDELEQPSVCVIGQTTSAADGSYRINQVGIGSYRLSAFTRDLKDGNVFPIAIRYQRQVLVTDITFRGGLGKVNGRVLRAENCNSPPCTDTPLAAKVSISGERLVTAGGQIGVKFEYVQNYQVKNNDITTGAFEFTGVWTGPFTLRAAGQFSPEPVAAEGVVPGPNQTVTIDLRLQPTSRLTGTVLEPDGFTPVTNRQITLKFKSNAVVVFCHDDAQSGDSECTSIPQGIQEAFAVTDAEGHYSFPLVNAGPFTITATDTQTGKVAEISGSVRAGDSVDVPLRLLGRSGVTVRVFRSDGFTPVVGATVELRGLDYPREQRQGVALDGTILFGGGDALSEGQFIVTAMDQNGFAGRKSGRVVTDDGTVVVDVFLFDATGTVTGQVVRQDTSSLLVPVANAEVILSNGSGPLAFALTDAQGHFEVPLIPTGTISAEAFDPVTAGRGSATAVVLGGSQPTTLAVRLEALGAIRGTVVQAGTLAPLKGWTVQLYQSTFAGRSLPSQISQTGVDGSFSFPGAPVGNFLLQAYKRGIVGDGSANGRVTRGGQLVDVPMVVNVIRRVAGTVTGIVVVPGGAPAPNAQVEVCASDGCRAALGGADGRFSVGDIPLGRFTVRASAQVTGNPSVGTAGGSLLFENDIADVTATLLGLSVIEGTVYERQNNVLQPALNATVRLYGQPGSGCNGACTQGTDAFGKFKFINVPAQTFTVVASSLNGQQGSIGDVLIPGTTKSGLEVILAPAVTMTGRVLLANGNPAGGVVADLTLNGGHLFAETGADGQFSYEAIGAGNYSLFLQDPVGGGIARKSGAVVLTGPLALGDITLDEAPPAVVESTPANGDVNVSRTTELHVRFSESLNAASVNATTITLLGPAGQVAGLIDMLNNDAEVRFSLLPGSQLTDQTRYTLRVSGVKDRAGRSMTADYIAAFTTVDVTPPSILETTPTITATGVSVDTVVRVKFNEIIDPSKFTGAPITLSGPQGAVTGRTDYLFSNTVIVFTPNLPLVEDAAYTVAVQAATDLTDHRQASGLNFGFNTTDRTPPAVTALTIAGNGSVIQNTIARATALVSTTDVAVVDFFLNGTFAFADRAAPFMIDFQTLASLAAPGGQIKVSAVATDTSGNRGLVPVDAFVTVVADEAPLVSITNPALTLTPAPGERVNVSVHATDDVGVKEVSYSARGLVVVDAATRMVAPAALDRSEPFAFNVPADAVPGSTITIQASAKDTADHVVQAPALQLRVRDAVAPAIQITGISSGQRVQPGARVTAVVSAADTSGIARLGFAVSGVTAFSEERQVTPAQSPVATSFEFVVPANATSTDRVFLDAFAVDGAGNRGDAARLIVPVADRQPPSVTVRTSTGSLTMVPGGVVQVIVEGTDDLALSSFQLTGVGAFAYTDTQSLAVPLANASATFVVNIPSNVIEGATEALTARATDASGNASVPVSVTLTARSAPTVTLPPSLLLLAGVQANLQVTLGVPAPSGGLRVDLSSQSPGVASVTPSVVFAPGETSKTASVVAVSGGSTQIDALVDGTAVATTTVTVSGGVVRGDVVAAGPGGLVPVPGAQVTVFHGGAPISTVSDAAGHFVVEGVFGADFLGRDIAVGASDGSRRGFVGERLDVPNGSAFVTVILLPVGAIRGTVFQADVLTAVGAGAKVDLFEAAASTVIIATTFTDAAGEYRFPLVAPRAYIVDASDGAGNRGRASVTVANTGDEEFVPIVYLGRGSVNVHVVSGVGASVVGAQVEFSANSLFGPASVRTGTTSTSGVVSFPNVFVGAISATGRDTFTNQAGSVSGQLTANGETATLTVQLAAYGNLTGTVFRRDGTTKVPSASVTLNCGSGCRFTTATDANGAYRFDFLPLGSFTITVLDPATRGQAVDSGLFTVSGEALTRNLVLLPQGALLVSVVDADGVPVNGATVSVTTTSAGLVDGRQGVTGNVNGTDGQLLLDKLLAGSFTLSASAQGLSGSATGVLSADEVRLVSVQLEARATIAGTVYEPDGQTPAAGSAKLYRGGGLAADVPLVNGTFSVGNLRLGTYAVEAWDAANRGRTLQTPVVLSSNGQVQSVTLTFVGLGTVQGRVIHPTGGDVGNLQVQLRSLNPSFGGFASATTDAAGNYAIGGVAIGPVTVTSSKTAEQLLGESSGAVTQHGQTVTLDILLEANAIALPTTLNDVQDSSYTIGQNGGLQNGTGGVFNRGGTKLELVANGTLAPFTGAGFGTREDGAREIAVRQTGLLGLNVTRKVFVPTDGYFARHLEILQNPTGAPITVDVNVTSALYGGRTTFCCIFNELQHFVTATSSGDNVLSASNAATADTWVSLASGGLDPYYNFSSGTPLAFVFAGAGAATPANNASLAFVQNASTVAYGWGGVTVPANGTVVLMHFVSEQATSPGATASAQRLVQLPPEAFGGLSVEEIASIANFTVPASGISTVAPLPDVRGAISGRVLEGDGATPVPGAQVTFRSQHPVLTRQWFYSANGSGEFSFTGALGRPVPVEAFELTGRYPSGPAFSRPTVSSTFSAGQTSTVQDYVFTDSGILKGVVRRHTGEPVLGAFVTVGSYLSMTTGADGRYSFGGVFAGSLTLTGSVGHPQGTGLNVVSQAVTLAPGQLRDDILLVEPTGTITGTVRDANENIQPSRLVTLTRSSFYRQTTTDTAGRFAFGDVPVGTFTATSNDPVSGFPTSQQITVVQDQLQDVTLHYVGKGSLTVTVTRSTGVPISGMTVSVSAPGLNTQTKVSGAGGVTPAFTDIPLGLAVTVTASHPQNAFVLQKSTTVTLAAATATTTIAMPAFGTVTGTVRRPNGTLAGANVSVQLQNVGGSGLFASTTTDANGQFSLGVVPANKAFLVRAYHPTVTIGQTGCPQCTSRPYLDASNLSVQTDAQALDVQTHYPAVAKVVATVQDAAAVSIANAKIETLDTLYSYFQDRGNTSASGVVEVLQVPEGAVSIRVYQPGSTTNVLELATGQVTAGDDGGAVPIVVTAKSFNVTVSGLITEHDGVTGLANPYTVRLLRAVDRQQLATTSVCGFGCSGTKGQFQFATLVSTGAGLIVQAFSPMGDGKTFDQIIVPVADGPASITLPLPYYTATLNGRVLAADGLTPVGNGVIFAYQLTTNAGGGFGINVMPDGSYSLDPRPFPIEGMRLEYNLGGLASGVLNVNTASIAQSGQTLTTDIVLPPSVYTTIRGTVVASDGTTPVSGAYVEIVFPNGTCAPGYRCSGNTSDQGAFEFVLALPADGQFLARVHSPVNSSTVVDVSRTNTTQGAVVDLGPIALALSKTTLRGTVVAGDGVTVVPDSYVEVLFQNGSCAPGSSCTVYTDAQGAFEFAVLLAGDGQFTVRAHSPRTFGIVAEATGSNQALGAVTSVGSLVLPISVLNGTATFGATVLVPNPTAFVIMPNGSARFADRTSEGAFTFYELPSGTYDVTVQDFTAGVDGTAPATLATDTSVAVVHVQLPEVAVITVKVFDSANTDTVAATVALFQGGGSFEQIRNPGGGDTTDPYVFTGVPLGNYTVQARLPVCDGQGDCADQFRSVDVNVGQSGPIDISVYFASEATALVAVFDAVGTPMLNTAVEVTVRSLAAVGPLGAAVVQGATTTDPSGHLQWESLPAGLYTVFVRTIPDGQRGVATGQALPGTSGVVAQTDLFLTGAVDFGNSELGTLSGADDYLYVVNASGEVIGGGHSVNGHVEEAHAFERYGQLGMRSPTKFSTFYGALAGAFEPGTRTFALTPSVLPSIPGVVVRREIFVPDAGGFARYIDSFDNTTSQPQTFTIEVSTVLEQSYQPVVDVQPSPTTGGYYVRKDPGGAAASFGDVFAGVDPPIVPTLEESVSFDGFIFLRTAAQITVPPGARRAFMHFVLQRSPGDEGGVISAAEELVNLSTLDMLAGLTSDDRASIVNFNVPQTSTAPGVVHVSVAGRDGLPSREVRLALVAGAFSQALGPFEDNGNGVFEFLAVPAGPYVVQGSFDDCSVTPCRTLFTEAPVTVVGNVVANISLSFANLGRTRLTVVDSDGNPFASENVDVEIQSLIAVGPLGAYHSSFNADLDPGGAVELDDLPPGRFVVHVHSVGRDRSGVTVATATTSVPSAVEVRLRGEVTGTTGLSFGVGGADSYYYVIGSGGAVDGAFFLNGGNVSQSGSFAFSSQLHVGDPLVCCALAVVSTNGELAFTPMALPTAPGIVVERRLRVPDAGHFLRYFDVFTNTSSVPQTLPVSVWTEPAASQAVAADIVPSSTTSGYFTRFDSALGSLSFGVVYAGPDALVVPVRILSNDLTIIEPTATMVLAPGQSVALLHYVVLRDTGDVIAATAQAEALGLLTDPDALVGLSPEDLQLIVNFKLTP